MRPARLLLAAALLGLSRSGETWAGIPPERKVAPPPKAAPEPEVTPTPPGSPAPPELVADRPPPLPLAITVSGAVSLGAWQAGFLYYLTESVKRNPELLEVKVLTGASAGTINALLTALEVAGEPVEDPRDSLFWALWNDFTYDEIFDVSDAKGPFLSSGAVLTSLAGEVWRHWERGLPRDSDLVLGAAVTREWPRMVDLGNGLTVPRSLEHFVLRIRGRGKGQVPIVENFVDPASPLPDLLLPLRGAAASSTERADFDVLTDVLFASSALPGAFAPRSISYCTTPLPEGATCAKGTTATRFMDGAISDRHPLRLAWRIAGEGLERAPDGALTWRATPDVRAAASPEDFVFLYMDPTHVSYPPLASPEGIPDHGGKDRIMATLAGLVGDLAGSAQASELYNLAEENPEVSDRLALVEPVLPPVSGELFKFFGFFDRRFRRYDFYLGMADAHRFVEQVLAPRVRARFGEQVALASPEPADPRAFWAPYGCVRAVVDGFGDPALACAEQRHGGYEVLLQTSIDRLWDHCRRLPAGTVTTHPQCAAAIAGARRPRVPNVPPLADGRSWKRRRHGQSLESDFDYLCRLLEQYRFEYRDFGLPRSKAWVGPTFLRGELGGMVAAYGYKLRGKIRAFVLGAGKPALNVLHYAPPATTIHLSLGPGVEVGTSSTGPRMPRRWLRFDTAFLLQGMRRFLTPRPDMMDFTPMAGLSFESRYLSGVLLQPRLELRAGYQFSTADHWGAEDCVVERFRNEPLACSVPVGQALLTVQVFERLRFHLGAEYEVGWFLEDASVRGGSWTALSGVGGQFISPFAAEVHRRATLARRQAREGEDELP